MSDPRAQARTGFACPECGGRVRRARPGAVVACAHCKNPVVVPEASPPPAEREAPVPQAGPDPEAVARKLWSTALGVIAVVGLAHLGLYLLLTGDARASLGRLEQKHDVAVLRDAKAPEGRPAPGTPAYRPWRLAKERWVDAEAWRTDRRQVDLLWGGFVGSFVVQAAITFWILIRLLAANRRRREALARAAAQGA